MKLGTSIHLVEEAECTHQLGHDLDFMLHWRSKFVSSFLVKFSF